MGAALGGAVLVYLLSENSARAQSAPSKDKGPRPAAPPAERPPAPSGAPPDPEPRPAPEPPPAAVVPDDSPDDETALARMLVSETETYRARVVVGWITKERARILKVSIFRLLTGRAGKYGMQELEGEIRYASTREAPTAKSRVLASDLISGAVQASEAIRARGISPWVELRYPRKKDPIELERRARHLLALQRPMGKHGDFGGIWARVSLTNWYLYSRRSPPIAIDAQSRTALAVLQKVPIVAALDGEQDFISERKGSNDAGNA